jgi:glycosyltransferase involved in cell wall biosynthesis
MTRSIQGTRKIAIFLTSLEGGGAERVMLNLARGFTERGLAVDLVLVQRRGEYIGQIPAGVRLVDLARRRLLSGVPALVAYLRRERPATLLSALEDTNAVAILARFLAGVDCRTVVTVHNHLSREARNARCLKRRLAPLLVRWLYPHADIVVAVSRGVAVDLLRLGARAERVAVIHNPVVAPEITELAADGTGHPWLAQGETCPVVLAVGRLNPQKDFGMLLRAMAEVRPARPARLIVLGQGEERAGLEAMASRLDIADAVDFPGFVENPFAYMAKASVLALSSAWEGFGNVLVEAMAVGTPVVSTDCESGPAEILENGRYGRLVPVGDAAAMAAAILETIAKPPEPAALQARAGSFSIDRVTDAYIHLLAPAPLSAGLAPVVVQGATGP